jgi:hypothetical protein
LNQSNIISLFQSYISEGKNAFSVGGVGAIAEFQDESPDITIIDDKYFRLQSHLGQFSVKFNGEENTLAYENRAAEKGNWQCGLVFTLPKKTCFLHSHEVLTELGEDKEASDPLARKHLLFDLGTGIPNMRFCIRTDDNDLIRMLREHEGKSIIAQEHPALEAIINASPHRIVTSKIARIEVFQKIDRHRTPIGPHTHLLPKLIKLRRLVASNIPISSDQVPQFTVYPEHSLIDQFGHRIKFDQISFDKFQLTLKKYGCAKFYKEKLRLRAALANKVKPCDYTPPSSKIERTAFEIELRQQAYLNADTDYINEWRKKKRNP